MICRYRLAAGSTTVESCRALTFFARLPPGMALTRTGGGQLARALRSLPGMKALKIVMPRIFNELAGSLIDRAGQKTHVSWQGLPGDAAVTSSGVV